MRRWRPPAERREYSAFSAAFDPNRTPEITIAAADRTYRLANKYAGAQHPLFGRFGRWPSVRLSVWRQANNPVRPAGAHGVRIVAMSRLAERPIDGGRYAPGR